MAKKAKPPRAGGATGAGVARAALAGLLGGPNPLGNVASPQARYNPMRPTPMIVPPKTTRRKGK